MPAAAYISGVLRRYLYALLYLLICVEALTVFWLPAFLDARITSCAALLQGILIGLVFMHVQPAAGVIQNDKSALRRRQRMLISVYSMLSLIAAYLLYGIYRSIGITPLNSDIIPTIQVAVHRLLSGDVVYREIRDFGYPLPLTYLPMQWMPFSIAALTHTDFRWMPFSVWLLTSALFLRRLSCLPLKKSLGLLLLLFGTLIFIIEAKPGMFGATVELLIAGYYMLLMYAIPSNNVWLKAVAITLCLLSRYMVVLWLTLLLFVELRNGAVKHVLKVCLMVAVAILLLYVLPFLSKDPTIFVQGYHYYTKGAVWEWQHLDDNHRPLQLYNGSGMAWLFYEGLSKYSIPDRVKSLQKAHVLLCIASVIAMSIYYGLKKQRLSKAAFLTGSFKIYLTVFLALIQVPYTYLMLTATFTSIAALMLVQSKQYSQQ